ncbi:MAG: ABC transporter permease [Proteobacteria bacterium]|nr:ABC transporter permease [Pseudomonadota bacterium]MBU1388887.1 ABC transporter permease [Pseudomonadota bacterium]MBU1543439.1 ABC transporter permease [Pseudomonadota bacterium]MBU2431551.1 ABC transporter permease [Pseudomonadota bacterium]MBU2480848.1 ABC transporter permease [Pseudomonadota bacterium]
MSFKRMWALFMARNYEFIRDRAGFGWNILFPFLIVAGFGMMFSSDTASVLKLGVYPVSTHPQSGQVSVETLDIPERLIANNYIKIVGFKTYDDAIDKVVHHKIDLLLENGKSPLTYWVNESSPKGRILEKLVKESIVEDAVFEGRLAKNQIQGDKIRYIDWLFPGIIGMNIMFSSLFGVGFVIVRYRRIGVLKRLKATPVTAFEYLTAQMASRVLVMLFSSAVVWFGSDLFFHFRMQGSYFDVFWVFFVGTLCLVSMGLVVASRGTSEELSNGIINFISWPMMFLSEVWFSVEGSSEWVKTVAKIFPLTHFLSAARKIINDGADLTQIAPELTILLGMTCLFLVIGSALFSWTK